MIVEVQTDAWIQLLCRLPQFADNCGKWEVMRPYDGGRLRGVCGRFMKPA